MLKLSLALVCASIFSAATPAFAEPINAEASAAYAATAADEAYGAEELLQEFNRPIRRRCFVRDRFRTYNNLRGCYRRSPAPRTCRQICR